MASSPTTVRNPNLNGQVITSWVALTATGGTKAMTVNFATEDPKIDLRVGHPVLNAALITKETNNTGSEAFAPALEMARAVAPDSTGEWSITDADTIVIYQTADQNSIVAITYICYGVQLQ